MTAPVDASSEADGLSIVLRHLERTERHELDRAAADCAPDVRFHGLCPRPIGSAEWREAMSRVWAAFPDGQFAIEDVLADGDRVAVRQTFHGTHRGVFLGIAPTGRKVAVSAMVVYRVLGRQIAESWWSADVMGLLRQLDALPPALM
jgi:predicted ester cyclase